MKISLLTLFLAILCSGCSEDSHAPPTEHEQATLDTLSPAIKLADTTEKPFVWVDTLEQGFSLGFEQEYVPVDTSIFEAIDSLTFTQLNRLPPLIRERDSSHATFTDSTFTIQTYRSKLTYTYGVTQAGIERTEDYGVYIPKIGAHTRFSIQTPLEGENVSMGSMGMIDSASNSICWFDPLGDGPAGDPPLFAPSLDYFVYYANTYNTTGFGLAKRTLEGNRIHYERLWGYLHNFIVNDIFWLEDGRLAFESRAWRPGYKYQWYLSRKAIKDTF